MQTAFVAQKRAVRTIARIAQTTSCKKYFLEYEFFTVPSLYIMVLLTDLVKHISDIESLEEGEIRLATRRKDLPQKMMVKLYKFDASPASRTAMMACELFNVPAEHIDVDLSSKEQYKPEFEKKNPLHTVPVLEDNDVLLNDSHAILMYLADVYGKQDSFYPKDPKRRAFVNQKLFFNSSILFPRARNISAAILLEGLKDVPQKNLDDVDEAYGFTEEFLSRTKYLAGDSITIADIAACSTISSLVFFLELNVQKYPKTHAWFKTMEQLPYVQKHNTKGTKVLKQLIDSKQA